MKTIRSLSLIALALTALLHPAAAQPFSSGSDGSYGPLNITTNTVLTMPSNGVFHCTTINIASGATLTFQRNALNTPVYLLATSNVTISGVIEISGGLPSGRTPGSGGPGGFDGGFGGFFGSAGGAGQGPGGGSGEGSGGTIPAAMFSTAPPSYAGTKIYGNALLLPLIGGSGGAGFNGNPGPGGCGGGGAILIASSSSINIPSTGRIYSRGGGTFSAFSGGGSGGGIRLVAPSVSGTGILDCSALSGYNQGSSGRIRIDATDRQSYRSLQVIPTTATVVTYGAEMIVFPLTTARLDIISAAGQAIPEGTGSAVQVTLPAGSSTNQTVVVQGRDFTNSIPLKLIVIPETTFAPTTITTNLTWSGNPSTINVPINLPVGIPTRIQAWTTY
jgi:hypothetical protein